IINYGTTPKDITQRGIGSFVNEALIQLNANHLNPQTSTIYEDLAKLGLQSGSINGVIYRGGTEHRLIFPKWLTGPTALPESATVKGPDFFAYGAFSNPLKGLINPRDNLI